MRYDEKDYRARVYSSYRSGMGQSSQTVDFSSNSPFLKNIIRRHFPSCKDAIILDLGCGAGALLHFASQAGYKCLSGVDTSEEQVALAKNIGIKNIVWADVFEFLQDAPFQYYDLVSCFDVIEHLSKNELLKLADEVYRILKPGGIWVIHCPNAESPFFGTIRYGDWTHEQAFTRNSIRQLNSVAGFASVDCFEDTPIPRHLKSLIRYLFWKLIRAGLLIVNAVETGAFDRKAIFSRNLLAVAKKAT